MRARLGAFVLASVIVSIVFQPIQRAYAPPPTRLDPIPSSDSYLDEYGATHTAYSSVVAGANTEIFYTNSRWNPLPVRLTFTDNASQNPQVYLEHNFSVVYVSWMEDDPGAGTSQISYVTSNDNGTTWTSPLVVGQRSPEVTWDMTVIDDRLFGWKVGTAEVVAEAFVSSGIYREAEHVYLSRYAWDTRAGEPPLPPNLRITSYPPGVNGYYLVQVKGLAQPDWAGRILATGAEIVSNAARLNYLLRMNSTERAAVQSLDFVRWVGIFQPGYRVHTSLDNATGLREMVVSTFPGENVTQLASQIASLGAQINFTGSLEGDGTLVVYADASLVDEIANVNGVESVGPRLFGSPGNSVARWIIQSGNSVTKATPIHDRGIDGRHANAGPREIIAIADMGADSTHEALAAGASYTKILTTSKSDWSGDGGGNCPGDETGHGTATASSLAGDAPPQDSYSGPSDNNRRDGAVFKAQLVVQDIGCPGGPTGEIRAPSNRAALLWHALGVGAMVQTNSWATAYDASAGGLSWAMMRDIDYYLWQHQLLTVIWEADNLGPNAGTLGQEARAKNVITIGASGNDVTWQDMAQYSSRGPSGSKLDRLKPTLVAPGGEGGYGVWTASPTLGQQCGQVGTGNQRYVCVFGTSFATPHAAGAAAMVRQYFTDGWYPTGTRISANGFVPSAALVRAVLMAGAVELLNNSAGQHSHFYSPGWWFPNLDQGWGRINLDNSLYFANEPIPRILQVVDDRDGIEPQFTATYQFSLNSQDTLTPLKVILAWTDPEGDGGNLVNDLSLILRAPDGQIYYGNRFPTSQQTGPTSSVAGGSPDIRNVEEGIILNNPPAGQYTLRIWGANVMRNVNGGQSYALAMTGKFSGFTAVGWHPNKGWQLAGGYVYGAGMATYDINQNGMPDAFFFLPNSNNILYYTIAWDLNKSGAPKRWGWPTTLWQSLGTKPWPVQGAGVALGLIDGDNMIDAYLLMVADLTFEDLYYWRLARDLGTDGIFHGQVDQVNYGGWGTGAWLVKGGGVSLGNLGQGPGIDALVMIIDEAYGDDLFRYRVAYDLNANGFPALITDVWGGVSAGGYLTAGGDVAILDVNSNGFPDAIFVASVDAAMFTGKSEYRYRIAFDYNPVTAGFTWSGIKGFQRVWTGPTTTAVGVSVRSLNGNGNTRDFVFMAVGDKDGFRVVFSPAFDMNSNGDIPRP